ncbi:pentatricopeptide repeat-containing protein At4g21065 isoform X1 [Cryptomeria japonica]|uniref:pentatricopeptide repeat-containing protein At4g21065 isoform X1 n=1 Tax=Cryptomeria japonica TaxID=3369 RepID=UPI0027DAA44B|nr:pentatricopeptide repeat-containing protein At4g21065 isoform X1 [Cryptomeria japonica]XP_059074169.1 pentatricopeptide repeat-containing protein At4g21065 isoform X1 [Cryptomeria japonica]
MSSIAHFNLKLRALCTQGRLKDAVYALLHTDNVHVDTSTYLHLLQTCIDKKALSEGKKIHFHISERIPTLATDTFVQNKIISMYDKCGSVVDARKVFNLITEPDGVSWNMIIAAYRRHGIHQEALALFHQMQQLPVQPDRFTLSGVLPVCAKLASLKHGLQIHGNIIRHGFQSDVVLMNTLIDMYVKCKTIEKARKVFDKMHNTSVVSWTAMITGYAQSGILDEASRLFHEMPQPNVVSWTAIIAGYAQNEFAERAMAIFKQMLLTSVKPDESTFACILSACAKLAALEQGTEIHQKIIESGFSQDVVVVTALVDMYSKCGSIKKANKMFDKMPQRNIVSWNTMVVGYVQNGLVNKAVEVYKQMQLASVMPDEATFASILPACAKIGALEQGMEFHQRIIKNGILSNLVTNALIYMYAKCGNIFKARELFDNMSQSDVVSWNAMIEGYAMNGYIKDALKLFELMKHSGTKPDRVSFLCVLFACSHAGIVHHGCEYFNCMSDSYSTMPTVDHYVCMVDLLARAGYLDETLNFIIKMPIKTDVVVWMCLLGACRSQKNTSLGEFVATRLFELDPQNVAPYVLLSNIYAETGRWGDAQKLRKIMKDKGMKKVPGCSWIEVHRLVHAFCVGDRSHPQSEEIYAELEKLSWEMKAGGYLSDTKPVLSDVEEEEKEFLLCHHSEKLAIAFGLINTPPGTTIRVVKNLRVCINCHTATKFISKIVAREIVVRDANRFHHFKNGQCSCGDYW